LPGLVLSIPSFFHLSSVPLLLHVSVHGSVILVILAKRMRGGAIVSDVFVRFIEDFYLCFLNPSPFFGSPFYSLPSSRAVFFRRCSFTPWATKSSLVPLLSCFFRRCSCNGHCAACVWTFFLLGLRFALFCFSARLVFFSSSFPCLVFFSLRWRGGGNWCGRWPHFYYFLFFPYCLSRPSFFVVLRVRRAAFGTG